MKVKLQPVVFGDESDDIYIKLYLVKIKFGIFDRYTYIKNSEGVPKLYSERQVEILKQKEDNDEYIFNDYLSL